MVLKKKKRDKASVDMQCSSGERRTIEDGLSQPCRVNDKIYSYQTTYYNDNKICMFTSYVKKNKKKK